MDLTNATSQIFSSVCKHATLKKVKTNKLKFFVLHKDSSAAPARLEYYDTESQWIKKRKAKRTIYLRTCFSINSFSDTKAKYGMTLFTKDDSFQIGFDSEQDRDMWLADMRLLSHSSHQSRSIVQHEWNVSVKTRGMKCAFEGDFKLCLNESQATLISKKNPEQHLELPLLVITHCTHRDRFFCLELSAEAETGSGEMWVELEDSLIAQHVYRAFMQNLSVLSPADDEFRQSSRSFSYVDRKSSQSMRMRSGSDARLRNRIGQGLTKLGQYGSVMMSSGGKPSSSKGSSRGRSDSIDSHSTSASMSTDDSEFSRAATPDTRADSPHPAYLPMNFTKKPSSIDDNCGSLSTSSLHNSDYTDMSGQHKSSHDRNSNFMYVDMTGGHSVPYMEMCRKDSGYLDMSGNTSPKYNGYKLKPQPVKCYLTEECTAESEQAENSQLRRVAGKDGDYVEMCRRPVLSDKDKSSSAPHLMPLTPHHQQDSLLAVETDSIRDRTSSMTCSQRPRGSSWSQNIRPRSSTTEHKQRRAHRTNAVSSLKPLGATDYVDMASSGKPSTDSYIQMCLQHREPNRQRAEDKENHYHSASSRIQLIDPFPELSASSEDDISLHSMEGSISLHSLTSNSLTSSADSMSMSSHSSHAALHTPGGSSIYSNSLDGEPYVAMSMQHSPAPYIQSNSHRKLAKPYIATSYILDDTQEPKPEKSASNNRC